MDNLFFNPAPGRIIITPLEPKTNQSSIILPDNASHKNNLEMLVNHPVIGRVILVGPQFKQDEMFVNPGDIVLLRMGCEPQVVKIKGKLYGVITNGDIHGVSTWCEDLKLEKEIFASNKK